MRETYLGERQFRRQRLILKLKIYGTLALLFLSLIGAAYAAIYTPIFRIKNVSVIQESAGEESFSANLANSIKNFIASRSRLVKYLGIDNILTWNENLLSQREFIEDYPQIAELTLRRDFLKREIDISVKKRDRFGIWCLGVASTTSTAAQASTSCYWFDNKGIIFTEAPNAEGSLIYKVNDYSGRRLGFGEAVLTRRLLPNLFKIFEVMDKSDLKTRSFNLNDLALEEIATIPNNSSQPVVYLSLRNDPAFASKFLQSLKKLGLDKAQYIDLRVENRVYYK